MIGSKIERMAKEAIAEQMRTYRVATSSQGMAALNAQVLTVSPHLGRSLNPSERSARLGENRVGAPRHTTPAASER